MKRHFLSKYILLLGVLLLSGDLYACSPTQKNTEVSSSNTTVASPSGLPNSEEASNNMVQKPTEIPTITLAVTPATTSSPNPTTKPTATLNPAAEPSATPKPTVKPSVTLTPKPTVKPSATPTAKLTVKPTATPKPTVKPTTAPAPTTAPTKGEALHVRNETITLGDSKDSIIKDFGTPDRIVSTEYDFDYYVYNNDYTKFLMVAIKDSQVVGYYTDSLDFSLKGIESGSSLSAVNTALGKSYSLEEIITHEVSDQYTIKVLMDKIGTKKAIGVYVLSASVQSNEYTDTVMRNVELLTFDLTNSVRARNGIIILTWSSAASDSSRKHSIDMATNDFFDHTNLIGENSGDRMKAEGISFTGYGENIIAGYGSAIISNHGWFNSDGHRSNMLNTKFKYLGVGFTYLSDSKYKTYCTQNFYK